jgi:hypothetical protein
VLLVALILVFVCFTLENACEVAFDWMMTAVGMPSRLDAIKADQATRSWIPLLVVSPIVENFICLIWLRLVFSGAKWKWWKGPLMVSLIAGAFHSLAYLEPRYMAISVNFFAICCLIANVNDRLIGFLASVFIHSAGNFAVMIYPYFM